MYIDFKKPKLVIQPTHHLHFGYCGFLFFLLSSCTGLLHSGGFGGTDPYVSEIRIYGASDLSSNEIYLLNERTEVSATLFSAVSVSASRNSDPSLKAFNSNESNQHLSDLTHYYTHHNWIEVQITALNSDEIAYFNTRGDCLNFKSEKPISTDTNIFNPTMLYRDFSEIRAEYQSFKNGRYRFNVNALNRAIDDSPAKQLHFKLRTIRGVESACYAFKITQDTTPPELSLDFNLETPHVLNVEDGMIQIRGQCSEVRENVTLTLDNDSNPNFPLSVSCEASETFVFSIFSGNLPSLDGQISFRIGQEDLAGNKTILPFSIILNSNTETQSSSIEIANGATHTNQSNVNLTLNSADAELMYITNSEGCSANGSWESYSTTKSNWELNPTQHNNVASVYIKFKKTTGMESDCYSDSIIHDTILPTVSINAPDTNSFINAANVSSFTVNGSCSEHGKIVALNGAGNSGINTTCSSNNSWSISLNFSDNSEGLVTLTANHSDAANNGAAEASRNFIKDTINPTITISNLADIVDSNLTNYTISGNCAGAEDGRPVTLTKIPGSIAVGTTTCSASTWELAGVNFSNSTNFPEGSWSLYAEISDLAGNAASPASRSITKLSPEGFGVVLTSLDGSISLNDHFWVKAVFSQNVSTLNQNMFNIAGGSATQLIGSGNTYLLKVEPTSHGITEITLPANRIEDDSNNFNGASNTLQVNYEETAIIAFSSGHSEHLEGDTTSAQSLTVNLSSAKNYDVSITYKVLNELSTTLNPDDLNLDATGTILIPSGETSVTLDYNYFGNSQINSNKILKIALQNQTSKAIALHNQVHRRVIIDDEGGAAQFNSVASGSSHICAINSAGVLKCWGENGSGRLGDNTTVEKHTPTIIDTGTSYNKVSAGIAHTCGITNAGVLKCWGNNTYGRLGDNTTDSKHTPTAINTGTSYSQISAGGFHSCGITSTGVLRCWGFNGTGQIGDNSTVNKLTPTTIDAGTSYSQIFAGRNHTCGITSAGALKCWGSNSKGQLGNNSTLNQHTPTIIDAGTNYTKISAAQNHTCGITSTGVLKCWGGNIRGQLGDNTTVEKLTPTIIDAGTSYTQIALSDEQTCAITSAGVLKCWGYNNKGQLGDNTTISKHTPTVIDSETSYTQITLSNAHKCAITDSAILKCWGTNTVRQQATPTIVDAGTNYNQINLSYLNSCGIISTGELKCWGHNDSGQIGNNTTNNQHIPTLIDLGTSYKMISPGHSHSCAITTDDILKCWGANSFGRLGDNTTVAKLAPVLIDPGTHYSHISSGHSHTCGITSTGVLKCWGLNSNGRLGDNTTSNKSVPTVIDAGTSYSHVASGHSHTCGITSTGVLKCWGLNSDGQLGDNTTVEKLTPTVIDTGTSYNQVSTGTSHTCGITSAGVLKCWGSNSAGLLGDSTTVAKHLPTVIDSDSNYHQISLGNQHSCGITSTGVLKCWGANGYAQLGDNSNTYKTTPTVIDSGTLYNQISSGGRHSCGITSAGVLKCWGQTEYGQLGLANTRERTYPAVVW